MISLFEGIENQDYLEIHVDSEGCETILNALDGLQTNGKVIVDAGMTVAKEGFQIVPNLILFLFAISYSFSKRFSMVIGIGDISEYMFSLRPNVVTTLTWMPPLCPVSF